MCSFLLCIQRAPVRISKRLSLKRNAELSSKTCLSKVISGSSSARMRLCQERSRAVQVLKNG